jgi:hypothetical protein
VGKSWENKNMTGFTFLQTQSYQWFLVRLTGVEPATIGFGAVVLFNFIKPLKALYINTLVAVNFIQNTDFLCLLHPALHPG